MQTNDKNLCQKILKLNITLINKVKFSVILQLKKTQMHFLILRQYLKELRKEGKSKIRSISLSSDSKID